MTLRKGQVFSTQPYRMYIPVNSGDLRMKLDLYYMRTCVSFITANTAINKVNVALLQHETSPTENVLLVEHIKT